jgi:hypothetical protein
MRAQLSIRLKRDPPMNPVFWLNSFVIPPGATCTTPKDFVGSPRPLFGCWTRAESKVIRITENIVITKYIVNRTFCVHLSDVLKPLGSFAFPIQPVHQSCSAEASRQLDRQVPADFREAVSSFRSLFVPLLWYQPNSPTHNSPCPGRGDGAQGRGGFL